MSTATTRHVYVVMSARSLPYAGPCLASLFRNAIEPFDLKVVTDDASDAAAITVMLETIEVPDGSAWSVHDKTAADERAASTFAAFPNITQFREGHPCWRKITDPLLFATPGSELIILDPDVYFPNRFRFEQTPDTGFLLMWQRPNCLLPEAVVRTAYDRGIAMADHTDIGVCQYRTPFDLEWLDTLIAKLGGADLPRSMHVESIVWAAAAEEYGGGYLDPVAWRCFGNTVASRVERRLGKSGVDTLRALDFDRMKCFHAGGEAKHWLADAERAGALDPGSRHDTGSKPRPFTPYPRSKFERKLRWRRWAGALGLYRLLGQAG